jgi:AGZA family xanthine/uracil permease-like MFS transporter
MPSLARFFKIEENRTTLRREVSGGVVTFLTMSYIIFVQPSILQKAGMDFNAVMMATCLSAALASILMGLLANYPIALAPGMGENFFFAFTVVLMLGVSWQQALGIVFISGVLFIVLTLLKVRQKFVDAIPASLKYAIAAGIGLFIGFIGLADAGIIVRNNAPLNAIAFGKELTAQGITDQLQTFQYASGAVKLGDFSNPATLLSVAGLFILALLLVKKVKGAMLWGIVATAVIGLVVGIVKWQGLVAAPPSLSPTFLKLSFKGLFTFEMLPIVIVFFIMDFFDTIGTLVGVSSRAGLLKDNKLPRASRALMADAVGTVGGALLGTSTVTSFIESAAGVEEGSRTGLSAVTAGLLFLLAIFFSPFIAMVGGGYVYSAEFGLYLYPITAPVLIIVAALMMREIVKVKWDDFSESIPGILTFIGIPLTYSIADGLAFGFISYTLIKIVSGKFKDLNLIMVLVTLIFLVRFVLIKL